MSLKAFHVVFIVLSTLGSVGFGVWSLRYSQAQGQGLYTAFGVGAFLLAVALVLYGIWFLKKLKGVSLV